MGKISISVRKIAEFLYGTASITNERVLITRAQEGTEIHQYWQSLYEASDQKEVTLSTTFLDDEIELTIQGRIDGIIIRDEVKYIEEIKSTYDDIDKLNESTYPSHLAQVKLYAYIYLINNNLRSINTRLTYVSVKDRNNFIKFDKHFSRSVIQKYFEKTAIKYIEWLKLIKHHEENRQKSIKGITFPFLEYRLNQREMMAYIYKNTLRKGVLYLEAPTGIGKTVAALFSSLKAICQPREKIFYLTAKNDGKKVVLDTVKLLEEKGLVAKTCEITAKDSMCLLKQRDCSPEVCKYANGYYKRVYKAISDLLKNETIMTKDIFIKYGKKYTVCPFELSLDISNYSDIIICDYNYVFDPTVKLIRYFEMNYYQPIVLCDEAHNLVSRSRSMYSAELIANDFMKVRKTAKYLKPNPTYEINHVLDIFAEASLELIDVDFIKKEEVNPYLIRILRQLIRKLDQIFADENIKFDKQTIREFYFNINKFLKINEYFDDDFIYLIENINNDIHLSIKCLNASKNIKRTIDEHIEAINFFSATLRPMHYYKTLLTDNYGDDIAFSSPFGQDNLLLLGVDDISTRYKDRDDSIDKIIQVTRELVSAKKGNYILFFPSYVYMNLVKERLTDEIENVSFIIQRREMFFSERKNMIDLFNEESEYSKVFLFVMGGIFGESIDLIGEKLSGVLIIGVGLPALSPFNNILRSHFDIEFRNGFDYAYTYPGLNKVIQAIGRVIRTESDRGVAILFDDRFTTRKYLGLYPDNWNHLKICNKIKNLQILLHDFWRKDNKGEEDN